MTKNIIIAILTIIVIMFWLKEEPDDDISDDPSDVTVEYNCRDLEEYDVVPPEVIEECRSRGFLVKSLSKSHESI